MTNFSG